MAFAVQDCAAPSASPTGQLPALDTSADLVGAHAAVSGSAPPPLAEFAAARQLIDYLKRKVRVALVLVLVAWASGVLQLRALHGGRTMGRSLADTDIITQVLSFGRPSVLRARFQTPSPHSPDRWWTWTASCALKSNQQKSITPQVQPSWVPPNRWWTSTSTADPLPLHLTQQKSTTPQVTTVLAASRQAVDRDLDC